MTASLNDQDKVIALTALAASAFTHYKKILQHPGEKCLPPTPDEARIAYQQDSLIHKCVDVMVSGIIQIIE